MKIQLSLIFLFIYLIGSNLTFAQIVTSYPQEKKATELFKIDDVLKIKLSYSNKELDKKTNDSTYLDTNLVFQDENGNWTVLQTKIRARGKFRRKNCYFPPAKLKIKKSAAKGTLFQGNKQLKLVLPCLQQKGWNDNVIKEYLAYKLFEVISPYHFKTRLVEIDFEETRGKRTKEHAIKGILIEDESIVAKRFEGKVLKRFVHPLQQDSKTSLTNAFFQFLIGNTDYSTAYRHNQKLLFVNKKTICIPYDFDMSGLVDASYSVVSQVQGEVLSITDVTQRMYRGFERETMSYQEVRDDYISRKGEMLKVTEEMRAHFNDPSTFIIAKAYVISFFDVLENDKKFKREILDKARTK